MSGSRKLVSSIVDEASSGRGNIIKIEFCNPCSPSLVSIATPVIEERRNRWSKIVSEQILELEKKEGISIEDLQSKDSFVNTLLASFPIALKTHQEEKIKALRNALYQSGCPTAPDENLQQMFLSMLDGFTEWHIRILKLFQNPSLKIGTISYLFAGDIAVSVIEKAFPELESNQSIYILVCEYLARNGLLELPDRGGLFAVLQGERLTAKRTTKLADELIRFIS